MSRILLTILACALLAACSGGQQGERAGAPADTLTQRQRDSIIGASRLPGAKAVERALRASDAARQRTELYDSLRR